MEWAPEDITSLRALWAEGVSTNEIGRRIGKSKNAVVGKSHRLDLPGRPSPIIRNGEGHPRVKRQREPGQGPTAAPKRTLPPLASLSDAPSPAPMTRAPTLAKPRQTKPAPSASQTALQRIVSIVFTEPTRLQPPRRRDGSGCVYPIGDPGRSSFRYCDGDLDPVGSPYCCQHHNMCNVRPRDPRVSQEAIAA